MAAPIVSVQCESTIPYSLLELYVALINVQWPLASLYVEAKSEFSWKLLFATSSITFLIMFAHISSKVARTVRAGLELAPKINVQD